MTLLRRFRTLLAIVLLFAGATAFLYYVPASTLIDRIGVSNAYAFSFLISLIAGFSSFTGTAAYAAVIEFARGGVNPLWLGLASGIGIFLSDSAFYALAMRGRTSLGATMPRYLARFHDFLERIPTPFVYALVYFFSAFGPIPNDTLLFSLVVGGYEYRKLWPFLAAGDITFMLFLSYLFQGS